jgi:hypothetical protein
MTEADIRNMRDRVDGTCHGFGGSAGRAEGGRNR